MSLKHLWPELSEAGVLLKGIPSLFRPITYWPTLTSPWAAVYDRRAGHNVRTRFSRALYALWIHT